jgi:hypothetical protein
VNFVKCTAVFCFKIRILSNQIGGVMVSVTSSNGSFEPWSGQYKDLLNWYLLLLRSIEETNGKPKVSDCTSCRKTKVGIRGRTTGTRAY